MEHFPGLVDFSLLVGVAAVVSVVASLLRFPGVAALLVAGAAVGPHGLALVADVQAIQLAAEAGVVLLLFSIGLSLSPSKLKKIGGVVMLGGTAQVGLTIVAVTAIAVYVLGESVPRGLAFGFVFALSSTAVVLRALAVRRELESPHGRLILGVLIYQDLVVVIMMAAIPALAASGEVSAIDIALPFVVKVIGVALAVYLMRLILPHMLRLLARQSSEEVFPVGVVALCAGAAFVSSLAGVSMALGAMLAGIAIADSEFAHRTETAIGTLRDVFASIFFVSLGMLFDSGMVASDPVRIVGLAVGLIVLKGAIATVAVLVMRFPLRIAIATGLGLAQAGEFGFLLAQQAFDLGLFSSQDVQVIVVSAVLTILVTPFFLYLAPRVSAGNRIIRKLEGLFGVASVDEPEAVDSKLEGHVVVAGYGVVSQAVVERLREQQVPYAVLELNPDTVRDAQERGESVYYADAANQESLRHIRLNHARALVIAISAEHSIGNIVNAARSVAPGVPILARSRYAATAEKLESDIRVVVEELQGAKSIVEELDGLLVGKKT